METMSIVVVGLNHRSAPISLLERLSIAEERMPKALHQLGTFDHVVGGAILSTCNRIEVYAVVTRYHAGAQDLRNFLSEFCHVEPEEFVDHLYSYHDATAVKHLFRVATGIDSMVVGESEILGQVRRAYQRALDEGSVDRLLGAVFKHALRVGKRVRTDTAIGRNPVSVSSAAVDLARRAFSGGLAGKRVAIVGAGKMGRLAAAALANAGASDLTVVNRSADRAEELADIFGATAAGFGDMIETIAQADILICSTTAPGTVIDVPCLEAAMAERGTDKPLFIVDIAVPRDVDDAAAAIPGVVLRDIDDLKGVVDANLGGRLDEVAVVEEMIAEELERFLQWERSTDYPPTAAALVAKMDEHRRTELARVAKKLDQMTPEQRETVEQLTQRLMSKFLHSPLTKARDAAVSKQSHLHLMTLRELFDLDDPRDDDDVD